MTDNGKQPRAKETKLLAAVIVALVVLYVALTAFVMRTNQTIGSAQLGLSTQNTKQLNQLQEHLVILDSKIVQLRDDQENLAAIMAVRLNRIEMQAVLISNGLALAESTRQAHASATTANADQLRNQLAAVSNILAAAAHDQGRSAGALGGQLTDLQTRLATAAATLAAIERQQGQFSSSMGPQLAELQKNLADLAAAQSRTEDTQLLARQLDRLTKRARALPQVTDDNCVTAGLLWQQGRLAVETARSEPQLADQLPPLVSELARLQAPLANAIAGALAKLHKVGVGSAAIEERRAALATAADTLALFPLTPDAAAAAQFQKLAAEHEAVRQQVDAAAASAGAPPK